MAKVKKEDPAKASDQDGEQALLIKTRQGVKQFYRAGMKFNEEGSSIRLSDLSDEQVEALRAEKELIVEDITLPVAGE